MDAPFRNVRISKTFCRLIAALLLIGSATVFTGIAYGIYYLIDHLQWVN